MVEGCWYNLGGMYQHGRKNCNDTERDVFSGWKKKIILWLEKWKKMN